MLRFLVPWLAAAAAFAAAPAPRYELSGQIVPRSGVLLPRSGIGVTRWGAFFPRAGASVSLFGTQTPFTASGLADVNGRFKLKRLKPGLYTLAIVIGRRETRRTVEVGPSLADQKGRVAVKIELHEDDFVPALSSGFNKVWAKQLSVPPPAFREYRDAQKDLAREDVASAVKRLEHAVDMAPQFAAAWNTLGTIAYQSAKYDRAEECFREALAQDPQSYEALVNLGGVLVTLRKLDEGMKYNLQAVLTRPNDPLANSQLGMAYFMLKQDDLAAKYLEHSRQLDPASFTYPQLLLSEIRFRQGDREAAAEALEDFLTHHPDWPQSAKTRETIVWLREGSREGLRGTPAR
jgi:thioredoxin-like negative regulator of GroEL